MYKRLHISVLASIAMLLVVREARADIDFDLTPTSLSVLPGGTIEFIGTLINTGSTDVYLNGDVAILPYTGLSLDDSPFFADSPLFLSGGASYDGPFFNVTADAAAVFGGYAGSFTIQGGADANAFDNLATESFSVSVTPTVTPEPGYPWLCAGLLAIIALQRYRHTIKRQKGKIQTV